MRWPVGVPRPSGLPSGRRLQLFFTIGCIQMQFLITFLLMFRFKESKLCHVDKSMRNTFWRKTKVHFFRLNFFYNAFRVITPVYIPTIGIITTVYSKTAP